MARIKELTELYRRCRLSRSAAGLSYYLLLALFPMIVCISILFTQFRISESEILAFLEARLGADLETLFAFQWQNPDRLSSGTIFVIALTLLLSASAGAFRCLTQTADDIFAVAVPNPLGTELHSRRFGGSFHLLMGYVFAALLFFSVYISIFVMVLWQELTVFLSQMPWCFSGYLPALLSKVRFLVLFLLFFCICYLLQYCIQPKATSPRELLPGSVFCAVGLGAVTVYFSLFIRGSAEYSLIYGSLASLVLLLTWVYLCGNLVLLGVALNCIFIRYKNKNIL